jgi:hypothetical protein
MIFKIYVIYDRVMFLKEILPLFSSIESKLEIYGWLPKDVQNNLKNIGKKIRSNPLDIFSNARQYDLNISNIEIILTNIANKNILPNIMFGVSKGEISLMHCRGWDDIYINPGSFIAINDVKTRLLELMSTNIIKDFEELE